MPLLLAAMAGASLTEEEQEEQHQPQPEEEGEDKGRRAAFSAVLEARGENDVRGHLFQFLQLTDIVHLSSLNRKWRSLGLEQDIRSVCASLPPHLDNAFVSTVALQRFLCKVGATASCCCCTMGPPWRAGVGSPSNRRVYGL